jgi:hypothetical protein
MSTLLAALLLIADPTGPAAAAPAAPAPAQAEKKICRVDPADTGSRLKRRLCLTETEWDKLHEGYSANDLKTMGAR